MEACKELASSVGCINKLVWLFSSIHPPGDSTAVMGHNLCIHIKIRMLLLTRSLGCDKLMAFQGHFGAWQTCPVRS